MNEITIGDKIYISSKRAAEITGYAKDYVGQLCREGHVDAKMVGRSWYVYEPSIRAHRFGEAVTPEPPVASPEEVDEVKEPAEIAPTWEKPSYTAESFDMIPEMPVQEKPEPPEAEETLTDMQTAWKEWFERKQAAATPGTSVEEGEEEVVDEAETPNTDEIEHEEEVSEVEEVEIPLHRLEEVAFEPYVPEIEEDAEPIAIHHIPAATAPVREVETEVYEAPARVIQERIVRRKKNRMQSYMPITALLIGVSIVMITVAFIGTGLASNYVGAFIGENPIINFLVGTSEFER